jgi:hypothetical protein
MHCRRGTDIRHMRRLTGDRGTVTGLDRWDGIATTHHEEVVSI